MDQTLMNNLPVKSLLVTGPGGCRMDFVAGWLSKLPNFVDQDWTIDPTTGRSKSDANITKILDTSPNINFIDVLKAKNYILSRDATYTLATVCHGYNLNTQLESIDPACYQLLLINPSPADISQIKWEFFIKTYLTADENKWSILKDLQFRINRTHRENKIAELINRYANLTSGELTQHNYNYNHIELDYNKLFVPGGSRYLINQLNISSINDRYHLFWDLMLVIAKTPDEIYQFDYLWKKNTE